MRILLGFLCVGAASSLGFVLGWSVGRSGPDPYVLAAVAPAIIAVFPGAALLLIRRVAREAKTAIPILGIVACVCTIALSGTFYGGILNGVSQRKVAASENAQFEYETRIARTKNALLACSIFEKTIVEKRKVQGINPLGSETICHYFMSAAGLRISP